jgi:hypothetical protein
MKSERVIKALIILAAIGGFVYLLTLKLHRSQAKGLIVLGAIVAMALFWLTGLAFDRRRRAELSAAMTGLGLTVGDPVEAHIVHRLDKGQRGLESKFRASEPRSGLEIAEFTFITGSGKHRRTHHNMQASRPSPGRWPEFRLTKRPGIMRRPVTELVGNQDLGLENERFAKRWSVECHDRDFVVLLLSPIIQDWLMLAPNDESWTIADGRVCITRRRKCDAAETRALVGRLDEFLAMLPAELAAYEAAITRA